MSVLVGKLSIPTVDVGTLPAPGGGITTSDRYLTVNSLGADVDVEVRLNRNTGGQAFLSWNGTLMQTNKPLVPSQLGITNISALEPASPFAGQVWIQP